MKSLIFLILISLVNTALLLYRLDYQSLWLDEVMSFDISRQSLSGMFHFLKTLPDQHPLYYLILRVWISLGTSEFSLRSLSVLFSVATLWALFLLAKELFNNSLAKVAVVILAFSPFYLYYGQEARMYTMLGFLATINSYFFFACFQRPSRLLSSMYILSGIFGVYTHLFFLFLIAAHTGFLVLAGKQIELLRLKIVLYQSIILLSYIPWAWVMLSNMPEPHYWKGVDHIILSVPYTLLRFSIGYSKFIANYQWKERVLSMALENAPFLLLASVTSGALILAGVRYMRRAGKAGIFVLCVLVLPMVISLLASIKMILVGERYFIISFPFYVMLLAGGVYQFWLMRGRYRIFGCVVCALFALVIGESLRNYYFNPEFGKEQWRSAAAFIRSEGDTGDVLLFDAPYVKSSFDYYYKGDLKRIGLPEPNDKLLSDLSSLILDHKRIWLILSHHRSNFYKDWLMSKVHLVKHQNLLLETGIFIYLFQNTYNSPN